MTDVTGKQILGPDTINAREALPLLNQYRRTQLQRIMTANGLSFDPVNTTGEMMRDILISNGAKVPKYEDFEDFVKGAKSKKVVVKEPVIKPKVEVSEKVSVSSGVDLDKMNFFQLRKMAQELGMDTDKSVKKDEILEFLSGKDIT